MTAVLQRAGRRVFLAVEAGFNAAFGDRLNPLYHLGEISFFLFWIVAVTGLYLYAWFDTGVHGAYASVEYLTQRQWWLGGVVRSLHRYASDAMVVTMLLHMARHFCFDRHRGFRWFSWITGVVVLWLVYAAGINGFMLPWDRLAQFVVVATAELLDWLPVFNGALIRNFIYEASVNDRLFSLLAFMHIGIPLILLLFLWIHIQRVPKASTTPPRPIWIALLATLVLLALVVPVVSHAPAHLGIAPIDLRFDWFYLGTLPIMYRWSIASIWALLAGLTFVLIALPWLPPLRVDKRGFRVTVHPGNRDLLVRRDETLLEAGLRAGLPMPFECRNGGCGVCKGNVLYGEVELAPYQRSALSDSERAAGKVLLCCAVPRSELEIEYRDAGAAEDAKPRTLQVTVAQLNRLAEDVMQVILRLPEGEALPYRAGQYLNVILDDGERRAFSFANPPGDPDFIELHVRRIPGGRFTTQVFTTLQVGSTLTIEGPLGNFVLHESDRPIIFVAGATGFAPVKSMLEHAFAQGLQRPMALYWGVRQRKDLYMAELPERWAREHRNFTFVPVLSEPTPEDRWTGRTGLVHACILEDYPDLSGQEIYACGSVKMIETAAPEFIAHGLPEAACFSDAFFVGAVGRS
ncbi:MAG TPA: 2Fe-2S iron-sulfur cluster-binding protein [Burkholderiales bacterium]|nr:2Fe-2S iron-sulfur cluster-binding protein [Burkholderiales bacterium]